MISYIRIEGFKSLKKIEIKIKPLTILIGLNSSGKSSVLQFLQALKQTAGVDETRGRRVASSNLILADRLINLGTFNDVVNGKEKRRVIKFGIGGNRPEVLSSPFGNSIDYGYSVVVNSRGVIEQSCDIMSGEIAVSGTHKRGQTVNLVIPISQGNLRFETTDTITAPFRFVGGTIGDFNVDDLQIFLNVIRNEVEGFFFVPAIRGLNSPSYPLDSEAFEDLVDARNLDQQARRYSSTVVYKGTEVENEINKWISRVTGITIRGRTVPDKRGAIEAHRTTNVNIVNEGFGSNQLVHLFAQLAIAPSNSLIGIEEPEVHLHPKAQSELAKVLAEISKQEKKNLIITTHSEHILQRLLIEIARGNLSPEDLAIYHFRLTEEGITEVEKLKVDKKGKLDKGLPDFFDLDLEEFRALLDSLKA